MTAAVRTAPNRTHHRRPQGGFGYVRVERRPSAPVRPNYAVRRAVVATIAVVLIAAAAVAVSAMVGVVVDVGGRPAAASDIDTRASSVQASHVAQPGDTLWTIADRYRGEVGHVRFVDALVDLNGGTRIEVGQAVLLP